MRSAIAAAFVLLLSGGTGSSQIRAVPVNPSGVPTEAGLVDQLDVVAESALAIRTDTGVIVFAKNIDEKRQVASTQKLLTALLIAESGNLDERVPVKSTDGQTPPRNLWITQGSTYEKRVLLEMMLIRSFNDVTKCLARHHSGSQGAFVEAMNTRAAQLGMQDSHFENAHGLGAEGQHSTARDMMRLAYAAWQNPEIRRITRIKESTFTYQGAKTIPVTNSNDLLHSYAECTGMKTGYIEVAGRCLVASAERGPKNALAVVLGSTEESVWADAEKLLRTALDQ